MSEEHTVVITRGWKSTCPWHVSARYLIRLSILYLPACEHKHMVAGSMQMVCGQQAHVCSLNVRPAKAVTGLTCNLTWVSAKN